MATATTSGRRFKYLRSFRLRTLLVLLSAVCLACGWEADRLHRRAVAVTLLERWGLWVDEEGVDIGELPWRLLPERARGWLSPWLFRCAGIDSHQPVCDTESLPLLGAAVAARPVPPGEEPIEPTPAERKLLVAAIATLAELPFVQVPFELDDDDLRALSRLTEVEILAFRTRGLTAAGVASILKLRKINCLTIDFDSPECVSLEAIAKLGQLPRLAWLSTARLPRGTIDRIKAALPNVDVVIEPLSGQNGPQAHRE